MTNEAPLAAKLPLRTIRTLERTPPSLPCEPARTGVARLDDLLGGGLPRGSATLLCGPPFAGKSVLQRRFLLEGLRCADPVISILTEQSASDASRELRLSNLGHDGPEHACRVAFIDLYTRLIGEEESHPHAQYLDNPHGWHDVLAAVDETDHSFQARRPGATRLVVQSISSLMVEIGSAQTFRFLRALLGRFNRRRGTALLAVENGMHEPRDIQTLKHLCRGMIEMREIDSTRHLRVEGHACKFQPGWVEYEFDAESLALTGSFSSGRIRHVGLPAAAV